MTLFAAIERRRDNNPKKIDMKNLIFKTLFSKVGPLVTALVSWALGWLVTFAAGLGIFLDANLQLHISSALTGLIWLTINHLVNKYAGDRVEVIQKAYGLEADRWLGPVTTRAATDPKQAPKRPTAILP
jgi:hypothetical protein